MRQETHKSNYRLKNKTSQVSELQYQIKRLFKPLPRDYKGKLLFSILIQQELEPAFMMYKLDLLLFQNFSTQLTSISAVCE